MTITDDAKQWILDKACKDKNYGARPLRRAIQRYIEDPLSEALIQGQLKELSQTSRFTWKAAQLWYRSGRPRRSRRSADDVRKSGKLGFSLNPIEFARFPVILPAISFPTPRSNTPLGYSRIPPLEAMNEACFLAVGVVDASPGHRSTLRSSMTSRFGETEGIRTVDYDQVRTSRAGRGRRSTAP